MVRAGIVEEFTDLIDKIRRTGDIEENQLQRIDNTSVGIGADEDQGQAEDATGILEKLASTVKLTFDIYGKAVMSAGEGTDEVSKALRALNINVSQFKPLGTEAGLDQYLTAVARALVDLNKAGRVDEANLLSTQILGKNYRQIGAALEQVAAGGGLDALKQAVGCPPEDVKRTKQITRR
jgi:hypothetical protein